MTGDPNNSASSWGAICGGSGSPATQTATAVATQNAGGQAAANHRQIHNTQAAAIQARTVPGLPAAFGVNPMVTVANQADRLANFFLTHLGNTGNSVSATATAEA